MSVPIGIDLGTTNTVVAAVLGGRAVTLEDEDGSRLIPSIVSFHPSGSVLVGAAGKERRIIDSSNTIMSVKRLIGRPWKSPEVQQARKRFPFDLREGPKETTMVMARGEQYALPEISAFVLRRAKQIAEAHVGEAVDRAVITVPANFNDLQRAATKVAGKLAGLEVLRILNEPTAAALAYGQSIAESERIAIFDLGGGTFDITLLDLSGSVFEVLATAGDTALGGDDVDVLIADRMADQFAQIHRYDPRTNPDSFSKLRVMAEYLKIQLSTEQEASADLNEIAYGDGGAALSLRFRMTRAELEHLAKDLISRTIEVTKFAIETIGQKKEKFDRVILVGGATRMPLVARKVEEYFAKPPYLKVNPDEVVALGAAIQAFSLDRSANKKRPDAPAAKRPQAETQKTRPGLPDPGEHRLPLVQPAVTADFMHAVVNPTGEKPGHVRTTPGMAEPPVGHRTGNVDNEESLDTFVNLPRAGFGGTMPLPGAPARPPQAPPILGRPVVPGSPRSEPASPQKKPPLPGAATQKGLARPVTPSMSFDLPELPEQNTGQFASPPSAAPQPPPPPQQQPPPRQAQPSFHPPPQPPSFQPPPQQPSIQPQMMLGKQARGLEFPSAVPERNRAEHIDGMIQFQESGSVSAQAPIELGLPVMAGNAGMEARHSPLLIDVTPLSLSVETVAGWCDVLIAANSPVPCDRTRVFLTAADGQTVVQVRVAQGESRRFGENTYLGEVELSGLKAAPRGEARIAVTFEIDADGILNVKATDELTGRETQAKMKLFGAQTDATDVAAMLARQARHAVS